MPSLSTPAARQHGFTLLEVLVALMMVGIILGSLQMALSSTLITQAEIDREMAAVEIGPTLLDRIDRDLMAIQLGNIKDNMVFRGQSHSEGGEPADRIDFIARTRSTTTQAKHDIDKTEVRSPVTEVGYRLRMNPNKTDYLELWRRQDFFVDEEPFDGGTYELLYDRIRSMRVSYLAELGEDAEEFDDWDMEERKKLPVAIKILLRLETEPVADAQTVRPGVDRRKIHEFERVILLPRDANDSLRVRLEIPDMQVAMSDQGLTGDVGGGAEGDGVVGGGDGGGGGFTGGGRSGRDGVEFREGPMSGGGMSGNRGGTSGGRRGGNQGGRGGPGGDLPDFGDLPDSEKKKLYDWFESWLKGGGK